LGKEDGITELTEGEKNRQEEHEVHEEGSLIHGADVTDNALPEAFRRKVTLL
jgi:hypothetical protein